MLQLGVNVDHVCTVREARKIDQPDPVEIALMCEKAGAAGITAHLREDRRHIQDEDMKRLAESVKALNMEMAVTEEMIGIAEKLKPENCCLVPEKREELTTEGGLDVAGNLKWISEGVARLNEASITVSLFIDPEEKQIEAAKKTGAEFIELHTGTYANVYADEALRAKELERLVSGAEFAHSIGLRVNAGHGINTENIVELLRVPHLYELNIGHSLIGRAIAVGITEAVREMLSLMKEYKN